MSKITVAGVRTNVQSLLDYSTNEKKRNFLETVELQVRSARSPSVLLIDNAGRLASKIMIPNVTVSSANDASRTHQMTVIKSVSLVLSSYLGSRDQV